MKPEDMIGIITLLITAAIMIGIGISQFKSKIPVGFYTNVEPPKEHDLTDMNAWNKKHGMMWITYGLIFAFIPFICSFIGIDSILSIILFLLIL